MKVMWKWEEDIFEKYLEKRDQLDPAEFFAPSYFSFEPEYFIVTELLEFKRNPTFIEHLSQNYPVLAHTADYLIYDLRTQVATGPTIAE